LGSRIGRADIHGRLHIRISEYDSTLLQELPCPRNSQESLRPSMPTSTSPDPTHQTNGRWTKTPMGWSGSICPRAEGSTRWPMKRLTWSLTGSIISQGRRWETGHPTRCSSAPKLNSLELHLGI